MSKKPRKKKTKSNSQYDTDLRMAWVAALRSGTYTQGRYCLKDAEGKTCVLGVLADLFVKKYPGRLKVGIDIDGRTTYNDSALVLPLEIANVAGLSGPDGTFFDRKDLYTELLGDTECSLANLDDRGVSWEDLADVISEGSTFVFLKG